MPPPGSSPRQTIRLFTDADLSAGAEAALDADQAHRLRNVMRARPGDTVHLFNGRDGEWRAVLGPFGRQGVPATADARVREQPPSPEGPWLLVAAVKRGPMDFIAEKASEMGVSSLQPVTTRRTIADRVNIERLRARAVAGAEQCGRMTVPEIRPLVRLDDILADFPADRRLFVGDETGGGTPMASALSDQAASRAAILIGPEGGFDSAELDRFRDLPFVTPVGLGPRILRVETAVIAALACWQALAGDWSVSTTIWES